MRILGILGKLTERIHGDEMRERLAAQKALVEDLEAKVNAEGEEVDGVLRSEFEQAKYRMHWYQIQVDWAEKNNK